MHESAGMPLTMERDADGTLARTVDNDPQILNKMIYE